MSPNPPQTLSVKRKRNEPVIDTLVVGGEKRRRKEFAWRLVPKPGQQNVPPPLPSPAVQNRQEFQVWRDPENKGSRVLISARLENGQATVATIAEARQTQEELQPPETATFGPQETPRPQKRPGARAAARSVKPVTTKRVDTAEPSEDEIKQFEQFSKEVEQDEAAKLEPPVTPSKFTPRKPALRYKERHPEKPDPDPDAMDIDDYVYDTYVREVIVPDAQGVLPEPQGTVGVIVLKDEDEDWWNGDDESDEEFDTDDQDENAEDYYANDYPEDELSSDDEFDRNPYQSRFRRGSDDEEFNLDDDDDDDVGARSDENEDDEHFRRVAPPRAAPGYWGIGAV
jgi:hypothetical protein